MGKRRSAWDESNRESFELWLVTRSQRMSTRPPSHPDEARGTGGTSKGKGSPNQDLTWLEAISQPDPVAANTFFEKALKELESHPVRVLREAYRTLWMVYIGSEQDESLPEFWRRRREKNPQGNPFDLIYTELLESAFDFVLQKARVEKRLLYWPTPEGARAYVEKNAQKRREARYHYLRERASDTSVTEAVRRAARRSGASEPSVWTWKKQGGWDANENGNVEAAV